MSASTKSRSHSRRTRSGSLFLHKPQGVIHPRVQGLRGVRLGKWLIC